MIDKDTIIKRWNDQADHMNQWDSLGEEEKIEWAYRQGLEDAAKLMTAKKQWHGGKWISTLSPETAQAIATAIRKLGENNV